MTTAYLAARGFETELDEELARAGVPVTDSHGRLRISEGRPVHAAWSANTWWDVERIPVTSIGHAAKELRARQRNWSLYAPEHRGRAELVADKLPYVAAHPLELGGVGEAAEVAPDAPLGSWTMLSRDVVLASTDCTSPFPNGEPVFVEDRHGPPSRAYLKLWETFARLRRQPTVGERCLDLGAAPGGWTWLLARSGAEVVAVDKAPLAPGVAGLRNVTWQQGSAFALDPGDVGVLGQDAGNDVRGRRRSPEPDPGDVGVLGQDAGNDVRGRRRSPEPDIDWWCSDIVCYPDRLLGLVERWLESGRVRNLVCTVKFQGATDHDVAARFAALPGARLFHLDQNKHELTCAVLDAS